MRGFVQASDIAPGCPQSSLASSVASHVSSEVKRRSAGAVPAVTRARLSLFPRWLCRRPRRLPRRAARRRR